MKKLLMISLVGGAIIFSSCGESKATETIKSEHKTDTKVVAESINKEVVMSKDLYNIKINDLSGKAMDLSSLKGKKILFVNVASECGFTVQYKDLQALHEAHADKVTIVGVPSNQFGGQEPGTAEQIGAFCQKNYGVEFLMTEKINVKGNEQHPLYAWLTDKANNGVKSSQVKWNFQKYLVDENGKLIDVYLSSVNPMDDEIVGKL